MTISYLPEVEQYLLELVELLYEEDYFSFREDAVAYVHKLRMYVDSRIHIAQKRPAPDIFSRYGKNMYYITYKANYQTEWYIFFQQLENAFLVRYITNNHVSAQYFSY